tara:strand:+ start:118 stop:264 length:147 start_codon:yes stop_codon:yes gene_type:complete
MNKKTMKTLKIEKISQSIAHVDANNSIEFVAADICFKKNNYQKNSVAW